MCTELLYDDILKAVLFVLETCKQKSRRSNFTLEKRKRGGTNAGKSVTTNTTHVYLSFDEIARICEFDVIKTHPSNS